MNGAMTARLALRAKAWVQRLANRTGYRIERARDRVLPIDVFDLAVRKRAGERGAAFWFLQIGANDGIHDDPIRKYVTTYHWSGLLVEPQPLVFKQLVAAYSAEGQLQFANVAIGQCDGAAKLYTVAQNASKAKSRTYLASFDRHLLAKQLPAGTPIVEVIVPAVTLQTLLTRHRVPAIDLLQIDAEGFDFQILQMLDFQTVKPAIIHYEHQHLSAGDRRRACELLSEHGYRFWIEGQDTTAVMSV